MRNTNGTQLGRSVTGEYWYQEMKASNKPDDLGLPTKGDFDLVFGIACFLVAAFLIAIGWILF